MMSSVEQLWQEFETDESFASGILIKRYDAEIIPDIYVALKAPERIRCLAIGIQNDQDISLWNKLQDLRFEIQPNRLRKNQNLLLLTLTNPIHKPIFSILCEDLIDSVANTTSEKDLIEILMHRFAQWENLFSKANSEGLTTEEQKGLFGELFVLRQAIHHSNNLNACLSAWTGPTAAARDFQLGDWAIEIKTTTANNPQKIGISNELQLDTLNLNALYLVHLSFEMLQEHGESLNKMVEDVTALCNPDPFASAQLRLLLWQAGYFAHHQELYGRNGYVLREQNVYQVKDSFPRLTQANLPIGVSEVKYIIAKASCESFAVEHQVMLNKFSQS